MPGLTDPWDFSADTVGAADLTLHAKWVANGYTVSFNSNGGTAVGSQTIAFGSLVATPVPDPTRTGHAFAGWFADAALTDPWHFATDTVGAADLTLHAKWVANGYTVSFNSNGGTAVAPQTIAFGSLVATPVPDPTRTGHAFAGWYADAGTHRPVGLLGRYRRAADLTLHAKWVANGYTVSFNSNGGTAVGSQTIAFGSLVATPVPDPTRTGHAFAGWYADAGLTDPWDFSADTVGAADLTLHAKWTTTYTITASAGAHGKLSANGRIVVRRGSSLTVTITPDPGYAVASVKVDGVSKGALRSYTFTNVTANHSISATFKRPTSTALSASAKSIRRGRRVTLYARLKSTTGTFSNTYIRFEVKLPGSSRYILLKKVKVSASGKATYSYRVLNRGKRFHRVRFVGNSTLLPAPVKPGLALRVR